MGDLVSDQYFFLTNMKHSMKKPQQANDESDHEPPKGTRLICPWPENCQEIHGTDWWSQVAKEGMKHFKHFFCLSPSDRLNVVKKLASLADLSVKESNVRFI